MLFEGLLILNVFFFVLLFGFILDDVELVLILLLLDLDLLVFLSSCGFMSLVGIDRDFFLVDSFDWFFIFLYDLEKDLVKVGVKMGIGMVIGIGLNSEILFFFFFWRLVLEIIKFRFGKDLNV